MSDLKQFPTFHCHPQSLDSASTPEAFAAKELELGSGHLTCTDHGTLAAARKVFDLGKKHGLQPIVGLESYFRDDNCPILLANGIPKDKKDQFKSYLKYLHLTMHFLDYDAYIAGVKVLSRAPLERHGSETKPLFNWNDIEELGSHNITFGSGCLIGLTHRHLVHADNHSMGEKYLQKLISIAKPGNVYMEMFPNICDSNWISGVFIELVNGDKIETLQLSDKKKVRTNDGECLAIELVKEFNKKDQDKYRFLHAVMENRKWQDREPLKILSVKKVEGSFKNECTVVCPDGDLQKTANAMSIEFSNKYNLPCVISDDSHFTVPDLKIVQDVRLMAGGGNWRFSETYCRKSSQESFEYFNQRMGIDLKTFESWIDNSLEWGSRFKDFKFETKPSLPAKFYPNPTLPYLIELIKKHGRMPAGSKRHQERLKQEIDLLHRNGTIDLLPYFFLAEDTCLQYENKGLITGYGRGSGGGVLINYLLGITHGDPLKYDLSLDRFITLDRIKSGKLPDIDQDLPSRDLLVGSVEDALEISLDDGTVKVIPLDAKVETEKGWVTIEEAKSADLDIIGFEK